MVDDEEEAVVEAVEESVEVSVEVLEEESPSEESPSEEEEVVPWEAVTDEVEATAAVTVADRTVTFFRVPNHYLILVQHRHCRCQVNHFRNQVRDCFRVARHCQQNQLDYHH